MGKLLGTQNIINSIFELIIIKLRDKCKYLNKEFIQVDTYYPSSQTCSRCNNINREMKDLSKREYRGCKCESRNRKRFKCKYKYYVIYYRKQYS